MTKHLVRIFGRRQLHFIPLGRYRRLPFLGSAHARNLFTQILGEVRERLEFSLEGHIVMPEHVHLLIGEPARGTPSTIVHVR
jgi:putative transposase